MNGTTKVASKKGDCECCIKSIDVELHLQDKMWMCSTCEKDHLESKNNAVNKLIEDSRVIDSNIKLKTDVFLARTTPAVELRALIEQSEDIAGDQKEYTFAKECMTRFTTIQKAIFEKRQELLEMENEMRMWQVNVQNSAGKLRTELRAEFRTLEVNYPQTPVVKKAKSSKPVKESKKFSKKELFDACKKYDVPAAQVQSILLSNHDWSYEKAAKHMAQLMGKQVN